jgi:hypothetical protein
MSLCEKCGVEVEEGLARCPLCGTLLGVAEAAPRPETAPGPAPPRGAPRAMRRWALEAATILAGAAATVVFAADFAYRMRLTWSVYPLASIAFLWVSAVVAIAFCPRTLVWLGFQTTALLLFLWGLDALTPGRPWFVPFALPAALLAVVLAAATAALARRRPPLQLTALALLAAGLYLLGLEQILNRYLSRSVAPGWSLVAFGCIVPVVLVLLFLHRSLRSRPELKRLFHL